MNNLRMVRRKSVKESKRRGRRESFKKFIKNYGWQTLVAAAIIAGVAGSAKLASDRRLKLDYASDKYEEIVKPGLKWVTPECVDGDEGTTRTERHPVISEVSIDIEHDRWDSKIVVVDWVYVKEREEKRFMDLATQKELTDSSRDVLMDAWKMSSAKLVTFVRHPYSCSNEAKARKTLMEHVAEGMYTWWFNDPLATKDGLLQALLHAEKMYSKESMQKLLASLERCYCPQLPPGGKDVIQTLTKHLEDPKESGFFEFRASPMIRAASGAVAIAATTNVGWPLEPDPETGELKGKKKMIFLEKGILEKQQIYDRLTSDRTPTQNKLVPKEAACKLKRLAPLETLRDIHLMVQEYSGPSEDGDRFISIDSIKKGGKGVFALDRGIQDIAAEGKFNVWVTHGGFISLVLNRENVDNNEAFCVLVSRGTYDSKTNEFSESSYRAEGGMVPVDRYDNERIIMQIVATSRPPEYQRLQDGGEGNFHTSGGYKELNPEIEEVIGAEEKGEKGPDPEELFKLLSGGEAVKDSEKNMNAVRELIMNVFNGCLSEEQDQQWRKKHCRHVGGIWHNDHYARV